MRKKVNEREKKLRKIVLRDDVCVMEGLPPLFEISKEEIISLDIKGISRSIWYHEKKYDSWNTFASFTLKLDKTKMCESDIEDILEKLDIAQIDLIFENSPKEEYIPPYYYDGIHETDYNNNALLRVFDKDDTLEIHIDLAYKESL